MDLQKVGNLIAAQRRLLGYTQEELGNAVGVSDKAVSKWERGLCSPELDCINRLAVTLKLDVLSLMTGEQSDASKSSFLAAPAASDSAAESEEETVVELCSGSSVVSPYLFGNNLEHTRSDVYGGISAQMLRNRKFAGKPAAVCGCMAEWYPIGERAFFAAPERDEAYTRHAPEHYHMKRLNERHAQKIVNTQPDTLCGIGQHGIFLKAGASYEFAVVLKVSHPVEMEAALTDGGKTLASVTFTADDKDWKRYTATLIPSADASSADLRLTTQEAVCLYVGAVSLMPADHFHGMRRDVVDALKELGIQVLRWPGGNFAGEYNWFDGLLPVDMRAPLESCMSSETQPHSLGYDFHEINTDDFIALCREIGAQPYLTINPTWNTPEESAAWVEYCNGDETTTYGRLRAERGFPEPYNVQLWSLGNELGYGHMEGDNTPYGYCKIATQQGNAMKRKSGSITLCTCGPYPNKKWADQVTYDMSSLSSLVSVHYYGSELGLRLEDESPESLRRGYEVCIQCAELARDRLYRVREQIKPSTKISFDEWNLWNAWYYPSSVTNGIFSALMMHMFIKEAEPKGVALVCHFEAVNEGAVEVRPDGVSLTAVGQIFTVMKRHMGGVIHHASKLALATERGGVMTVTLINPSYDAPRTMIVPAAGETVRAECYRGRDILPHSVFETEPAELAPHKDGVAVRLPARSVVLLQLRTGR